MQYFIGVIIFFTSFFLVMSLYLLFEDSKARQKRKLLIRLMPGMETGTPKVIADRFMEGAFEKSVGWFVDLSPLMRLIEEADAAISVGRLLTYCLAFGLGALLLVVFTLGGVLTPILALAAGAAAPLGYLMIRRSKRELALVSQLPDAIDMISRGLRAGQGLDAALQEVARSFPAPVGTELRRIYEEMTMGLSFEAAIRSFEHRFYRVMDVRMLCAALLIQRETGGNLTAILDNIAHMIRERFTFDRQVRTLSAEGRLSAMILGSLPFIFCLITWLIQPEYVQMLFTHPSGKKVIMLALILETAGFLLMYRLARVKV